MTKDEIIKLSNRELRIKAAELAGWKDVHHSEVCYTWFGTPPPPYGNDKVPNYPNDLTAAMELWKQVPECREIWWYNGVVNVYWNKVEGGLNFDECVKGKPEELPRLLTQAFVIYKEDK